MTLDRKRRTPREPPPEGGGVPEQIEELEARCAELEDQTKELYALVEQLNFQIASLRRVDQRNTILTNQPEQLNTPNGAWP